MTTLRETLKPVLPPIHRAGYPFIAAFAGATLVLGFFWTPLFVLGCILTVWCIYFFRDPPRVTPIREGLVISPADGVVQMIVEAPPPPELEMGDTPLTRISVFMNVFNCHVNRSPVAGRIAKLAYRPGKFFNASLDKASEHNERQSLRLTMPDGRDIACVQIAGLVARRILCEVSPDQSLQVGDRIGMIRFGSRVDIYLPTGVAPLVVTDQTTIAGETVLADLTSAETARQGEIR